MSRKYKDISQPKKSRHYNILMHWMSVKLADNFQIREHSWPCLFQGYFVHNITTNLSEFERCRW